MSGQQERDFRRDSQSGALISTNMSNLQAYRRGRAKRREMEDATERLNKMEGDISDIKEMLGRLLGDKV